MGEVPALSYKARNCMEATTAEAARWASGRQVASKQSRPYRRLDEGASSSSSSAAAGR